MKRITLFFLLVFLILGNNTVIIIRIPDKQNKTKQYQLNIPNISTPKYPMPEGNDYNSDENGQAQDQEFLDDQQVNTDPQNDGSQVNSKSTVSDQQAQFQNPVNKGVEKNTKLNNSFSKLNKNSNRQRNNTQQQISANFESKRSNQVKKDPKTAPKNQADQQVEQQLDQQNDQQDNGSQDNPQDSNQENSQQTGQDFEEKNQEESTDSSQDQIVDDEEQNSQESLDEQSDENQQKNGDSQNSDQENIQPFDQQQLINTTDINNLRKNFDQFNEQYANKNTQQEQVVLRFVIYSDAANKVNRHNSQSNRSYSVQINEYADQTLQQFQSKYLMKGLGQRPKLIGPRFPMPQAKEDVIKPIDWKVRNATTPPKHQKTCGSCWAFSVIGALESHIFIKKKGPLIWLSQQQLLDCCDEAGYGCNGCKGSWLGQPLNYLSLEGVATDQDYPYAGRPQFCVQGVRTKKYLNVKTPFNQVKGVDQLKYALMKGPVSVIVDSSRWDPLYKSGIFSHCPNGTVDYNHAAVLVGMTKKGVWTLKNSWGPKWGEQGYIRLPPGNSCGISDWAVVPIIEQ